MYIVGAVYLLYILGGICVNRKYINKLFIFISLLFASAAFFVKPDIGMDLYRHYELIDYYRTLSIDDTDKIFIDPLYVKAIFFYLISLLPSNRFLPAIAAFLIYFINLHLIYKIGKRYNVTKMYVLLSGFLFIVSTDFLASVSGIRAGIVSAIFFYAFYKEKVENKFKMFSWTIYILLCFFHTQSILFILFRLIIGIKRKGFEYGVKMVLLLYSFGLMFLSSMLAYIFDDGILTIVSSQIESYLNFADYSYLAMLYTTINLAFFMVFSGIYYNKCKYEYKELEKFLSLSIYWLFLVLGSISVYTFYIRLSGSLYFFEAIFLMLILNAEIIHKNFGIVRELKLLCLYGECILILVHIFFLFQQHYVFIVFG